MVEVIKRSCHRACSPPLEPSTHGRGLTVLDYTIMTLMLYPARQAQGRDLQKLPKVDQGAANWLSRLRSNLRTRHNGHAMTDLVEYLRAKLAQCQCPHGWSLGRPDVGTVALKRWQPGCPMHSAEADLERENDLLRDQLLSLPAPERPKRRLWRAS